MHALQFYDVESTALATDLELGDIAPGSSADSVLCVHNQSDLYQAEDVTVSVHSGEVIQLWLSLDGDSFRPSISVGDIPPGGNSPTFWLRRVTPSTAPQGHAAAQLRAVCTAWTNPVDTTVSDNVAISTEDE